MQVRTFPVYSGYDLVIPTHLLDFVLWTRTEMQQVYSRRNLKFIWLISHISWWTFLSKSTDIQFNQTEMSDLYRMQVRMFPVYVGYDFAIPTHFLDFVLWTRTEI